MTSIKENLLGLIGRSTGQKEAEEARKVTEAAAADVDALIVEMIRKYVRVNGGKILDK